MRNCFLPLLVLALVGGEFTPTQAAEGITVQVWDSSIAPGPGTGWQPPLDDLYPLGSLRD